MGDLATSNSPLCKVADLDGPTLAAMRRLYQATYGNPIHFESDLAGKDRVLLLTSPEGHLSGFTTLQKSLEEWDGQTVTVFFSGDTVVEPSQRHRSELPRLWAQTVFPMVEQEAHPCYWFLICSGFRTYRFLPVFYRQFYPRYEEPTPPAVRRFLDQLGRRRFATLYDAERGVVRLDSPCLEPLPARKLDAHANFFLENNPGWVEGHELACLTRLHPDNQTPALRRLLRL
jgi:hypothetical protein